MSLDMFLEILGTFEAFATHVAAMRLERNMDSDVASDVIPFDSLGIAVSPGTGQTKVICRFASDVCIAQVILSSITVTKRPYIKILGFHKGFGTAGPLTSQFLSGRHFRGHFG
jgi:hypothetical protein